jgi:DNA-binding NtrC family response regulator
MARILIVDDEADVLRMLSTLFHAKGHEVSICKDGNEAINLIRDNNQFDLLISDVRMSPINGLWLLSFVKKERPSIPVIIVTAYYSKEMAVEALRMGAHSYISKPFDTQKLLDTAEEALARAKEK